MATAFNQVKNRAFTTLVDAIDDTTTPITVTLTDGSVFPATASGHFNVTIDNEILHCTALVGNEMTLARGGADAEGTSKAAHAEGATVALNVTAKSITDLNSAVNAIEVVIGTVQGFDPSFADTTLSGTPKVLQITDEHGTPYYVKVYPTKV
jgi:hypothetical protein